MEERFNDMQDKKEVTEFHQSNQRRSASARHTTVTGKGDDKTAHLYSCAVCGLVLARTNVPMEELGVQEKLRRHSCQSPGKQDFERELR